MARRNKFVGDLLFIVQRNIQGSCLHILFIFGGKESATKVKVPEKSKAQPKRIQPTLIENPKTQPKRNQSILTTQLAYNIKLKVKSSG